MFIKETNQEPPFDLGEVTFHAIALHMIFQLHEADKHWAFVHQDIQTDHIEVLSNETIPMVQPLSVVSVLFS